jgi:two-component sensor histidine kinase
MLQALLASKGLTPIRGLLAAAFLPVIVLATVLGGTSLGYRRAAIEADALARAKQIAANIENALTSHVNMLLVLAETSDIEDPMTSFVALGLRLHEKFPTWRSIRLTTPDGRRVVDAVASVGDRQIDVVDVISHRRVADTRMPTVGPVMRGVQDKFSFAVRVPVIRDGDLKYVLTAVIDPISIHSLINTFQMPEHWMVTVIDSAGNIAARTWSFGEFIGAQASDSARAARERGDESVYDGATIEGIQTLTGYKRIPGWGWSVHVGVERSVVFTPLRAYAVILAVGGGTAIFLMALFLYMLAQEYTRIRSERDDERVKADADRNHALLTRELYHRSRNLMQIVGSLARMTFVGKKPVREELQTFAERLHAVAVADTALTESSGDGAALLKIVNEDLQILADRIDIQVDDVFLNASMAQTFSLAMHELATNAIKHGSLSVPDGKVSLTGKLLNGAYVLRWIETGGPPASPPSRTGFGMRLLDDIARSAQGRVKIDFTDKGLIYELRINIHQDWGQAA